MTKKGVMNTLQQDDMPPNMDEGCQQHHPLQDQFAVVSSNAVLAFGMIAAHIAGCLVVPSPVDRAALRLTKPLHI
jgi:hypothetical protein